MTDPCLQTASIGGRDIAEWVMNNKASLNLKYVIWGQRIWSASEAVKPWAQWRTMEDRGNVRENHWYVNVMELLHLDGVS